MAVCLEQLFTNKFKMLWVASGPHVLCCSVGYLDMLVCRAARAAAIAEAEAAAGEASEKALRSRRVVGDSLMRTAREVGT